MNNKGCAPQTDNRYCLGFMFSPTGSDVVLIQKQKPSWQRFRFNGVGGKIEEGESARDAMIREFDEETGLHTERWHLFCVLSGVGFRVCCFSSFSEDWHRVQTQYPDNFEGGQLVENIFKCKTDQLPDFVIPNLRWLIPMALSMQRGEPCKLFGVSESSVASDGESMPSVQSVAEKSNQSLLTSSPTS